MVKVLVVGAGIVGLATAARLARRGDEVLVVDKEPAVAEHQTGRNSGVIHSGLYYAPGSLKARLGNAGAASMKQFASEHGVPMETTGKLVVAVDESEIPGLHRLAERAVTNRVPGRLLSPDEVHDYEPRVACVGALRIETTGIVDYRGICQVLADQVREAGGEVRLGAAFVAARGVAGGVQVRLTDETSGEWDDVAADALVACAGVYADRVARACGIEPDARIVPFRGEYFELTPTAAEGIRGLIYPVPDPRFPFLGVHLTRMVTGGVHVGPNAVLALAREGYRWRDISPTDVYDALSWPGLWHLGARNWAPGAREVARSASRTLFARSLARLVPGIGRQDLEPAPAGVRAQALRRDGGLVDDFLVQSAPRQVHVLNAPSPAATAALEIAAHLERQVDESLTR